MTTPNKCRHQQLQFQCQTESINCRKGCHCFREIQPMDITSRWFALCVHALHSSELHSILLHAESSPQKQEHIFHVHWTQSHSESNLKVPIPKIMPGALTPDWIFHTFSDILGPGFWQSAQRAWQAPGQSRGWDHKANYPGRGFGYIWFALGCFWARVGEGHLQK